MGKRKFRDMHYFSQFDSVSETAWAIANIFSRKLQLSINSHQYTCQISTSPPRKMRHDVMWTKFPVSKSFRTWNQSWAHFQGTHSCLHTRRLISKTPIHTNLNAKLSLKQLRKTDLARIGEDQRASTRHMIYICYPLFQLNYLVVQSFKEHVKYSQHKYPANQTYKTVIWNHSSLVLHTPTPTEKVALYSYSKSQLLL